MNQLTLAIIPFTYTIDNQEYTTTIGEFIIDDKSLCEWFGLGRNLANAYTELDVDKLRLGSFIRELKGEVTPSNQFGAPRLVLYRCHCGCDFCGVISTKIIVQENTVIWQNVGYENDDELDESELDEFDQWLLTKFNFTFDKIEYFAELDRFYKDFKCTS